MRLRATVAAVYLAAVMGPAATAQVPTPATNGPTDGQQARFTAPVSTDQLMDSGLAAFQRGDHVEARRIFRQLAQREVPAAETLLGTMATNGQGGPRDDAVAAAWFIRAARRGYAPAQLALADSFSKGRGVKKDQARARSLARAAAVQGQPGAMQVAARNAPQQVALVSARRP